MLHAIYGPFFSFLFPKEVGSMDQTVIPAISTYGKLKTFLSSEKSYGLLMDFQLAELEKVVASMHEHNKKALIHLDLIKGLASDQYGAIHCIQNLKVHGIITSRPRVIPICKKRQVLGILRIFLKDRHSLSQSLNLIRETDPDVIEVLPQMPHILPYITKQVNKPILMGGLITNATQIEQCINHGAAAITTSSCDLWTLNIKRKEDTYDL